PDALGWRADAPLDVPAALGLDAALEAGRRGEALVLVLSLLGDRPLSALTPAEAKIAVSGLRRAGLVAEARALAIEIALSAGL
ncbi:MAG: hypothetical protein PHS60_16030, partial [Zavarzinia sp.]|nr:hypothetical protein [Zavarzinia sp.]